MENTVLELRVKWEPDSFFFCFHLLKCCKRLEKGFLNVPCAATLTWEVSQADVKNY